MSVTSPEKEEMRILILPPTRKDGEITHQLLSKAGMVCVICPTPSSLAEEIERGAGAMVVTEHIAASASVQEVVDALEKQQPWSDLPVVMLLHQGMPSPAVAKLLAALRNVTVLERPAPVSTVVSTVEAALRARQRQYQIRRLLDSEQAARRESERVNRIKDEFLATLSHELRTPLNSILGWSQLLKMDPTDVARVTEAVEVIDRNVRVQTQLIEDLLDMSRIISGKIRLDVQSIEISEVIHAALDAVAPAMEAKQIRLELVIDPRVGAVSGDFGRLQQILWNLITNAVKFTPKEGRIHVLCERVNSHVEVSVTDTGEGIEADFLPHIFERFSQADGSITRRHGGLGLGLSIVKNLVELHGGAIHADSPGIGKGATFRFRLPLRVARETGESATHPRASHAPPEFVGDFSKLRGVKVLVVDDEPDARKLVKRFLAANEAVTELAASAAEAQDLLATFHPDVIISDIGMPGTDGYEFMRGIRTRGIKTPAIALTAFARAEDRIRSLQAGFQSHLPKPVEPAELLALVIRLHER
jgi:signal transduction histidine kinase